MADTDDYERILEEARAAEAATLWDRAAELYERCLNDAPPDQHAELLTSLGRCHRLMAEPRAAWRFLMRAITLHRQAGDRTGATAAALEALRIWAPEERLRQVATEALEFLGPGETPQHAWLLLHLWREEEGEALARKLGCAGIVAGFAQRAARLASITSGDFGPVIQAAHAAHQAYAAERDYERASGALRGAGYDLLEAGLLDEGERLARDAWSYAASKHLGFARELAALDVAGVAFARGDFAACGDVLDALPSAVDFRADLYRMWMTEAQGEVERALAMMPSPESAGGAAGALSQVHAGRGGLLFRAGRQDAARAELQAWADAARRDGRMLEDAPAIIECIVALADDATLRAIEEPDNSPRGVRLASVRFSTLQGRGTDYSLGAVALRRGRADDARRHFETGLAWAQSQRCPADAGRCRAALEDCARK